MARILITGLKEPAGGIESVVLSYLRRFDASVTADLAVIGEKVRFESDFTARGGKVFYLPNRVRDPKGYKTALKEIFSSAHYDAVWCNFSGLTNIDFLKEAKKAGVPKRIAHAHTSGYFWGNILMKYLVPIFHNKNKRIVSSYATHLWACSEKAAMFMFGKKVTPICNAIELEKFKPDAAVRAEKRAEFGIAEDAPVVGHIGRMCSAKNQCFLLDIFKELLKAAPSARLLFVGDGELKEQVLGHAQALELGDRVIFTGARTDAAALLQACDCFLLPSVSEGLPVVLIEAQAAELPCVTSEGAVTAEVNAAGMVDFVPLSSPAGEWAEHVLSAINRTCENGAERLADAGYDIAVEAKRMQEFFER